MMPFQIRRCRVEGPSINGVMDEQKGLTCWCCVQMPRKMHLIHQHSCREDLSRTSCGYIMVS